MLISKNKFQEQAKEIGINHKCIGAAAILKSRAHNKNIEGLGSSLIKKALIRLIKIINELSLCIRKYLRLLSELGLCLRAIRRVTKHKVLSSRAAHFVVQVSAVIKSTKLSP